MRQTRSAGNGHNLFVRAATLALAVLLAIATLSFIPSNARDNRDAARKAEMIALVLEWGRLAPFPASAANLIVETEGSAFTRTFRASFFAPADDIRVWIQNSPGLREAVAEDLADDTDFYRIAPGGGADRAEVRIDYALNRVEIYVSWS